MQHGRQPHGESSDDPARAEVPSPAKLGSSGFSGEKPLPVEDPRFGGLKDSTDEPPATGWRISRSHTMNDSTLAAALEWEASRRALVSDVQRLIRERQLHSMLTWQLQEIEERETCCSRLLVLDHDLLKLFKDVPVIRFLRVQTILDLARLLAQLAIAYKVNNEPLSAEETLERFRSATVVAYQLLKSVAHPSIWDQIKWLLDRRSPRPDRRHIERVQKELVTLYNAVRRVHRNDSTSARRSDIRSLEDAVAEVAAGKHRDDSFAIRVYTNRLLQLYAIQADYADPRRVSPRAFAYLKTLEAWFAYALADLFLRDGDREAARDYGASASNALEVALVDADRMIRNRPEKVAGVTPPSWRDIQSALTHLMRLLSDLRQRLR